MSENGTPEPKQFRYRADMAPPEPAPVAAKDFRCPNCGAPVTLELPGKSQTVRCQKCSSILEPDHDVLKLREKYNEQFPHRLWIPLGREGRLNGIKFKCVGMVVRSDDDDNQWSEYLLFNPYHGYRYLVESSGHWTLVEQTPYLGYDQNSRPGWYGPTGKITLAGKKFRYYTHYTETVKNIIGEFPWQATIGETNEVTEYLNPPFQASCENVAQYFDKEGRQVDLAALIAEERKKAATSDEEDEDYDDEIDADTIIEKYGLRRRITESNWSIGEYKYPEEIKAAFALEEMPPKYGLGMCEPNPMRTRYLVSLVLSALLTLATCGTCTIASGAAEEKVVIDKTVTLNTADFELKNEAGTDYLEFSFEPGDIELSKETNVEFALASELNQEWISLNIFMINEQTGNGYIYDGEISYYFGGSGEDAWTEGSRATDFTTQKMPPGKYYLFIAGATNIGVSEFKRALLTYGERRDAASNIPTTGPLQKMRPAQDAKHIAAETKPPEPQATAAPTPEKNRGKLLPLDFAGKAAARKLSLQLRAKRDVATIGWGFAFILWLLGWNIYYYIRYRMKEGER